MHDLSRKNCPFAWGSGPPSNIWFVGCSGLSISIGSGIFAQLTADSPYSLQWAMDDWVSLSPRIAPSHGVICTQSNTWFHGPSWVLNPNSIPSGSAILAGLTTEHTMGALPSSILPLPMRGSGPPPNTWFLGPIGVQNPTASRLFQPFCTAHCSHSHTGPPPPFSKLPVPLGDLDPHLIHGSLVQPKSSVQAASLSVQQFLQGWLLWQSDRITDHTTHSSFRHHSSLLLIYDIFYHFLYHDLQCI